jgi:hypothetical protein
MAASTTRPAHPAPPPKPQTSSAETRPTKTVARMPPTAPSHQTGRPAPPRARQPDAGEAGHASCPSPPAHLPAGRAPHNPPSHPQRTRTVELPQPLLRPGLNHALMACAAPCRALPYNTTHLAERRPTAQTNHSTAAGRPTSPKPARADALRGPALPGQLPRRQGADGRAQPAPVACGRRQRVLHHSHRSCPPQPPPGATRAALTVWWSEWRCAVNCGRLVRPGGYGRWREHEREVDFFLEYDRGTGPLDAQPRGQMRSPSRKPLPP